jgi:hypothetical protein
MDETVVRLRTLRLYCAVVRRQSALKRSAAAANREAAVLNCGDES